MADTVTEIAGNNVDSQNIGTDSENQERTFTQSELDEIVKTRLTKERAKYADYETLQQKALKFDEMEEANKSELQKATERADSLQKQIDSLNRENAVRTVREKVSKDTGVPSNLLNGETEEDCMEQAVNILAFKNASGSANQPYPSVKDGGEVSNVPGGKSNGELFMDFINAQLK